MKAILSLLCASGLLFSACGADDLPEFKDKIAADETVDNNDSGSSDDGTTDKKLPVMGTYTKKSVNVEEISGI